MKKSRKRLALSASAAAILAVCIPASEGVVYRVYRDPVGIATYCVGETENPEWGRRYTHAECMALLRERLAEFHHGVKSCVRGELSDTRTAAYVSLAYNIGVGGFCKSSVVRLHNAGERRAACDAILKFRFAKGIPLPGLARRRNEERALCLKDAG